MMKKFFIHTMGCKSNQFESAVIEENLLSEGFEKVSSIKEADFFVLNSCSVTQKSDSEALRLLRSAKKNNPEIKNFITGCFAQIERNSLLEYDYIDAVIGNDEKLNFAAVIKEKCAAGDIGILSNFHEVYLNDTSKSRAGVKIQDGCDNRCAYCIIPFARGRNRSAAAKFVLEQISRLEQNNFREVVLTGIHIGQWGKDFGSNLLELLKLIEKNSKIDRYRLGSLNPLEISDEMLDFLSHSDKFCPHFHLSLQSACNSTLKRMNRFYKVEDYLNLIDRINEKFELPFIGSDIIAGFVAETQAEFETTVENLSKSGLTRIHVFPYSIRKGTQAALLEGHQAESTKHERAKIIQQISDKKFLEFVKKNLGTVQSVLLEKKPDAENGLYKGVSANYLKVFVENAAENDVGNLVNVRIFKSQGENVFGKII